MRSVTLAGLIPKAHWIVPFPGHRGLHREWDSQGTWASPIPKAHWTSKAHWASPIPSVHWLVPFPGHIC